MSMLYPSFYLISDLDPKNDTTHGLMDFLSHVKGEIQTSFMKENIAPPEGYSLWQVFVDDHLITHAGVYTDDLITLPYYSCNRKYQLPGLGDMVCWKEAKAEITPVPSEAWCWIVDSDKYQQRKVRVKPYAHTPKVCENARRRFDDDAKVTAEVPASVLDGITVNGIPVSHGTASSSDDGAQLTLHVVTEDENVIDGRWSTRRKRVSVTIPMTGAWDKYLDKGLMRLSRDEESATLTIGGTAIKVGKDATHDIPAALYKTIVDKLNERKSINKRFLELMDDTSYSLTVSGADALRVPCNTPGVLYKIAVQDPGCIATYVIGEDLSCEPCNEDGEFSCVCDAGQEGAVFKVGGVYYEGDLSACEPMLFCFKKSL